MHHFKPFTLNLKGKLLECQRPLVMGIVNITDDSFYAPSRVNLDDDIKRRVEAMIQYGADIIDLGAYSTRPGAADISPEMESRRIERGMETIRRISSDIPVSIDTFRSSVALRAITEFGADIINDISGGDLDPDMYGIVAQLNVPYILSHTRGTPSTMSSLTEYENVTADVLAELGEKINRLALMGVNDIIVDPGFGFAKSIGQNFELLRNLELFHLFERPLLVGISRKSMIYRSLDTDPANALAGTIAANTIALSKGASILRVHDVKEAVDTAKIVQLTYPE